MLNKYLLLSLLLIFCTGCTGPNSPQHVGEEITQGLAKTGRLLEDVGDDVTASLEGKDTTDRHEFVDSDSYKPKQP